jgi:hypothetical protein
LEKARELVNRKELEAKVIVENDNGKNDNDEIHAPEG